MIVDIFTAEKKLGSSEQLEKYSKAKIQKYFHRWTGL